MWYHAAFAMLHNELSPPNFSSFGNIMKYAQHSCSFPPTHEWLWGGGFLLVLFGPVVLTLLDNVAVSKSLSLNSDKNVILFFLAVKWRTDVSSLHHQQVLALSAGAPLAMLLHHQRPARDGWESLRDSFGLLSPSACGAWLALVWGVSIEKLRFTLQGDPFKNLKIWIAWWVVWLLFKMVS